MSRLKAFTLLTRQTCLAVIIEIAIPVTYRILILDLATTSESHNFPLILR